MRTYIKLLCLLLLPALAGCGGGGGGSSTPATGGTISGTVTSSTTSLAVAGATVATDAGGYTATTGSDGKFSISNVTPGNYTVTVTASGYQSQSKTGVTVVLAQTAQANFSLTALSGTSTISGTVRSTTNIPISGITVATTNGSYSATTGTGGTYTISSVAPGTYSLTASGAGYSMQTLSPVTVTQGQTTTTNFSLATAGTTATLAESTDNKVSLVGVSTAVPSGVTPVVQSQTAAQLDPAPSGTAFVAGVLATPAATTFSQQMALTFKLSSALVASDTVDLFQYTGGAWQQVSSATVSVSADRMTVTALITQFSADGQYAVLKI